MAETFRLARADEIPAVARVVKHSFPGPARTLDWWQEYLMNPPYGGGAEILWVGEDETGLIAACQLHPLRQWIAGVPFASMGLGTVAIAPTHRRRGLAGRLVATGLRHARERGDLASALYPFRISFYERLGYGLSGEAMQYLVAPETFPDAPERLHVRLAVSEEERAAVRLLYERWMRRETGQAERPDAIWQRMWDTDDQAVVLYRNAAAEPEGYAVVRYRTDLPPADRFLEVEERVWITHTAQRALYAWLASLGDQWQRIAYRAHPEEGVENYLREPRLPWGSAPGWRLWFPAATLLRGPMFRLVNVPGAWEARRVADDVRLSVTIEVRDAQVPENAGPWRLRFEQGRIAVEASAVGASEGALTLSPSTLARLFIGDLVPSAAVRAGIATADPAGVGLLPRLDAALRLPRPWTFDRF